MMQRVAIAPSQRQENQILLTPQQQHYLYRVLRLSRGYRFIAMDGGGQAWIAELGGDRAKIIEQLKSHTELPINVTLIAALPKGNGFDEGVRSCTELGVTTFIPVLSDRVLLKPSPQKLDRWRRIAREAAEQSERTVIPTLLGPSPFNPQSFAHLPACHRYLCVARGDFPHLRSCLSDLSPGGEHRERPSDIVLAVGPEGGWTAAEVAVAVEAGFQPVSLGKRVLRAVTAPIVALSLIAAHFES